MVSKIVSAIPFGYEGAIVEIEGDCNRGLPGFQIVGMGNKTIEEARERVRSAITNSGLEFPAKKITINLAPAELRKDSAHLDLPIALSVVALSRQLTQPDLDGKLFVGELALDGSVRQVNGIINIIEAAKSARKHKIETVFVPFDNLSQAQMVPGMNLVGVKSLRELFLHLKCVKPIDGVVKITTPKELRRKNSVLLDHISGQASAKRAITIAIAGRHNILISGPPGAGKTMLAKAAANLLPELSDDEKLAITKIHSLTEATNDVASERPFRSPHHTASATSIIGGGNHPKPGEISLAHLGVLFLDEMPEYPRNVLESLRQPMEDRQITISRTGYKARFPADFMLIATMNPCPCGYLGDPDHECTCTMQQIASYRKRLSGPLLDRIDLVVPVNKVPNDDLLDNKTLSNLQHSEAQKSIETAIRRQQERYKCCNFYNTAATTDVILTTFNLSAPAKDLIARANQKLALSARSYFKVIKVARTIADIANSEEILPNHVSEALQYRKR